VLEGEKTQTVAAPPHAVWEIVSDLEGYPDWHPFFSDVDVLERGDDGRVARAACKHGTPIGTLKTEVEVRYDDEDSVTAKSTKGDIKQFVGAFDLARDGDGTSVTFRLVVDPGTRLGLVLRGPVEDRVRQSVLNGAFTGLEKRLAESG